MEDDVGCLLRDCGVTLAVAESCTGGLIAHRMTSVPGSSEYFLGGVVAYANAVKIGQLGVDPETLGRDGAVSAPVAAQMSTGVRRLFGSSIAIGITGIAGPGGGTAAKPVGLVFIGLADAAACVVREFRFSGSRREIRETGASEALDMLLNHLQSRS